MVLLASKWTVDVGAWLAQQMSLTSRTEKIVEKCNNKFDLIEE
jgi:hypothetical protein